MLFNIIIFLLFICVAYPYYLIHIYLPQSEPLLNCGDYPNLYDVPFFFVVSILIVAEALVLEDIEKVIVSKKIFNFKSLSVLIQLYNSFMFRYNLYSNVVFAHNIYFCKKAVDLGTHSYLTSLRIFFKTTFKIRHHQFGLLEHLDILDYYACDTEVN